MVDRDRSLAELGLTIAPEAQAPAPVLEPLIAYVRGHATGDPAYFRRAFRPSAHVEGIRDGQFVSWPVDTYCDRFTGQPAEDESTRRRRLDLVRVESTIAVATLTLHHGPDHFTDMFVLLEQDGEWRIANKVYHRAPADAASAPNQ
ncbi:nuclear transport factor 2 family protein [Jiangella asiatica]|uniref:Nuclear transport factor 2 family protein n=1 Tax=Jiangella asiatica TaxID=2530372 RepID=A0A4R5DJX9_9ACTN|nr:nuclear transport factor 2 family protein [Jiangella asiatica]TDE14319.1 nuclear transport factor 2 family protein [Jiangella asiatica]